MTRKLRLIASAGHVEGLRLPKAGIDGPATEPRAELNLAGLLPGQVRDKAVELRPTADELVDEGQDRHVECVHGHEEDRSQPPVAIRRRALRRSARGASSSSSREQTVRNYDLLVDARRAADGRQALAAYGVRSGSNGRSSRAGVTEITTDLEAGVLLVCATWRAGTSAFASGK